jgi:hypothetical protein
MNSTLTTIIIYTLHSNFRLAIHLDEPIWKVSRRAAEILPNGFYDQDTNKYMLLYHNLAINTLENRMKPIGSIISSLDQQVLARPWPCNEALYKGNSSE